MMSVSVTRWVAIPLSVLTFVSAAVYAGSDDGGRERPQKPPQEAIDACADLSEGDSCSFSGRRGEELEGCCITPPKDEGGLVCVPEGMNRPSR